MVYYCLQLQYTTCLQTLVDILIPCYISAGKTALTGSPACAYYFNPNITEARPFYNRCIIHSTNTAYHCCVGYLGLNLSIHRFKNVPIYIQRPLEEETGSLVQEISLPEKTIAALDQIDPFNEEVCTLETTPIFSLILSSFFYTHALHIINNPIDILPI
jgi:hypothetical protein